MDPTPAPTQTGLSLQQSQSLGGDALFSLVLGDPSAFLAGLANLLSGIATSQATTPAPGGGQVIHKDSNVFQRLHAVLSDPYGRIATFDPVAAVAANPLGPITMAVATNYPIPTPPGARRVSVYIKATSPTNDVAGFFSTGITWGGSNPNGLAYDASQVNQPNGGYTGLPIINTNLQTFSLSPDASSIHLATSTASAVAIVGFMR